MTENAQKRVPRHNIRVTQGGPEFGWECSCGAISRNVFTTWQAAQDDGDEHVTAVPYGD